MSQSTPRTQPRLNNTSLRATTCGRCHLPILTGWDNELAAQRVNLHPALINYTNALAALHLGHHVTQATGTHTTGFRAQQTWEPRNVERLTHTRSDRNKQYFVWHTCTHLPQLNYQPIPAPPDPTSYDLFNQPPPEEKPPY